MRLDAIVHSDMDVYALDADEVVLQLRTGKDITAVRLIHEDPYAGGSMGSLPWSGGKADMRPGWELRHSMIWTIRLRPRYKRLQYCFELHAGAETQIMLEDGFYSPERAFAPGRLVQYFRFPWMNASDAVRVPQWPADTIWYQIFPDRFCRSGQTPSRMKLRRWGDNAHITPGDFYGGDLKGIISRLPYLHELGVTGVYMTPVQISDSNHKYNIFDYNLIDPDFGTDADMRELTERAHALGMRVMIDAVFNHCGLQFAPWQDVLKNGRASRYADWFFINSDRELDARRGTQDGRYFSFAFARYMPKLNTNNPEVAQYLIDLCRRWIEDWQIDGIRFDVGNEVAHSFLKNMRAQLKAAYPDVLLLGEIWHDASPWMRGDEYDSVMHYPFVHSLNDFWMDKSMTSRELMYAVNRCLSMYPEGFTRTLFTFLDTHDTPRARTRCASEDVFFQQLTLLLTMPGSPCLYYGTEIAMQGGHDPDNRRTMPWAEIDAGLHEETLAQVKRLIALRKAYAQLRAQGVRFVHSEHEPRLIVFDRYGETGAHLRVMINAGERCVPFAGGMLLYGRKAEDGWLMPGGVAVLEGGA